MKSEEPHYRLLVASATGASTACCATATGVFSDAWYRTTTLADSSAAYRRFGDATEGLQPLFRGRRFRGDGHQRIRRRGHGDEDKWSLGCVMPRCSVDLSASCGGIVVQVEAVSPSCSVVTRGLG